MLHLSLETPTWQFWTKSAGDVHKKDMKEKSIHFMNSDMTSMYIEKIKNHQSNPQNQISWLIQLFKYSCNIKDLCLISSSLKKRKHFP